MLKNYLLIALRNLKRHKAFSVINILGLAIGMAVCILIMQYVNFENSYDKFHNNYENIYRVQFNIIRNGEIVVECAAAVPAVGPEMKENFPEVLEYCRAFPTSGIITYNQKSFRERKIQAVTPSFIKMLSFPLIKGDPETALVGANRAVITESTAKRFFGDEDPIGKVVYWNGNVDFEITGVCADVPDNSHLKFSVLISHDTLRKFWGESVDTAWGWYDYNTYVMLADGTDYKEFDNKFEKWLSEKFAEDWKKYDSRTEFPLQPIASIHLYSDLLQESEPTENGDGTAVKFLTIIAFFILLIAWVNYINLSTSKAMERAKEVGVRKVSGAQKTELIKQFMLESLILNLISLLFAFVIVKLAFPLFVTITDSKMPLDIFANIETWIWLTIIFFGGSVISGLYPAFILSSYKPIVVLKGVMKNTKRGSVLRKSLVVFQFFISVALISCVLIVFNQMSYLRNKDLGINLKETLVIKSPGVFASDSLRNGIVETFKQEIMALASVKSVTVSTNVPGVEIFWGQGSHSDVQSSKESEVMYLAGIDHDFITSFNLKLIAGTNFTPNIKQDQTEALVNRAAVKRFGFEKPEDIIGKTIYISDDTLTVKGVLENFNQMSLKTNIIPLAFPFMQFADGYYSLKINSGDLENTISQVKSKWEQLFPGNPFDYFFLDDHFNKQYKKDLQFGTVFGVFSGLAIFIACLGLFALASFSAVQRTKEIGVRKALGATVNSIVVLLAKDFMKLIALGIVFAVPVTYVVMNKWLETFAYRVNISGWIFILSALIVAFIASITIAWQTIKTAVSNPVEALKYE